MGDLFYKFNQQFSKDNEFHYFICNEPNIIFRATYQKEENNVYITLSVKYSQFFVISKSGEEELSKRLGKQGIFSEVLDDDESLMVCGIYNLEQINEELINRVERLLGDSDLMDFFKNIDRYCINIAASKIDYFVEMFFDQVDRETLLNCLVEIKEIALKMDEEYRKLLK